MTAKSAFSTYSEQDTADKLILPYLWSTHSFPKPESLDYQAQHSVSLKGGSTGRYDGLYLSGGYPYAVLEAKRYSHKIDSEDVDQARSYATSKFFEKPVPYIIVSNGRKHQFFKKGTVLDPKDGKPVYDPIPACNWSVIVAEKPGEIKRLLGDKELLETLLDFQRKTVNDLTSLFSDPKSGDLDVNRAPSLAPFLSKIVEDRKKFASSTAPTPQKAIQFAIEAIALHFTTKILFIKLIEDLSAGSDTPRIIHTLFPKPEYELVGGLFGFKVLNGIDKVSVNKALRLYIESKKFYSNLSQDLAAVSWQDIFRFGFNVHMAQYGKLFKAHNYDKFLPSEDTLWEIRKKLIEIDIRSAVIYRTAGSPSNVIGDIYEKLIDDELRNSIGAVYTPDTTMEFMVALGKNFLGGFRGKRILEPACGSGHFYRRVYREYVNEILDDMKKSGHQADYVGAHAEAIGQIFGRDIDPFAVQLTLLGIFLEQLRDNVRPSEECAPNGKWSANMSVDTQNSLDPITVSPSLYFDIEKTDDLHRAHDRRTSCERALNPDLILGNPPYGVSVVRGAHYDDIYELQSKDSYGYFIVNALKRLPNGRRVIFIVSSSFLTIQSHKKLRNEILRTSKIIRIIKLNRSTFPGIDIFPVIIELEKCSEKTERDKNYYQYYDLWQLHPVSDEAELDTAYKSILSDFGAKRPWPVPATRSARFIVRQGVLHEFDRVPIFEGMPSLYKFMRNVFPSPLPQKRIPSLDGSRNLEIPIFQMRKSEIVKLRHIASVRIGLQSGGNARFYRVAKGVSGGAVRGGYQEIDPKNVVTDVQLAKLTDEEKGNGIQVDDPSNDRYFVPLDKPGEADIEGGMLSVFYRPVEFFVDWSQNSVSEMKSLKGARFQNSDYYFSRGVSFSNTGLYSPTFRLSHGGVFDQKGSCVFSEFFSSELLLGILGSTLAKYFVRAFINHGVDAQLDELPIVLPTKKEANAIEGAVYKITKSQRKKPGYDYRKDLEKLDNLIFDLYRLKDAERDEVRLWWKRRYPALGP